MSFGKGSGSKFPEGTEYYYIDIRTKGLPAPVFRIQTRDAQKKYHVVEEAATHLSGDIVGVSNRETKNPKANNAIIRSVSLVMEDRSKRHAYFINVPHSYLGWSVMNALCALKTYENVSTTLYQSKPREGQDKTFPSVSVRQDGEIVYGKFENKDLPEVVKVQVGEEVHSDKSKRQAFFIAEVDQLSKAIRTAQSNTQPVSVGDDTPTGEEPPF